MSFFTHLLSKSLKIDNIHCGRECRNPALSHVVRNVMDKSIFGKQFVSIHHSVHTFCLSKPTSRKVAYKDACTCAQIYVYNSFHGSTVKVKMWTMPSHPSEGNCLKKSSTFILQNPKLVKDIKAKLKYGHGKTFKTYC